MLSQKTLKNPKMNMIWTLKIKSILKHLKVHIFFWVKFLLTIFLHLDVIFYLIYHILSLYKITPKKIINKNVFV